MIKTWKLALGLGAACAACCAVPLLGVAVGLAATGSGLAVIGSEFVHATVVALSLAAGLAGVVWWRRRQAAHREACACPAACTTATPCRPAADPR